MSCYFNRGTGGGCSQVYRPYCNVLENDCQFCGPYSVGASCANWNGQLLFGNSCCLGKLRQLTEPTLLKRKSFSKRIAEEIAEDKLKNKKKIRKAKNTKDLKIMLNALENYCDPNNCGNCENECGKCGTQICTKEGATNSKTAPSSPSEITKMKKHENEEGANKAETAKYVGKPGSLNISSARTRNGRNENQLTAKTNDNKAVSTSPTAERKQFNELEICNILTDLLVQKFKAIDYTNKMLGSKSDSPTACCSKCICDVCSCLGSTDGLTDVEAKIGTATGALISENLHKGKNLAQKDNNTRKLKAPKETLPNGMSPMAAINTRRHKGRSEQKSLIDASTSMDESTDDAMVTILNKYSNTSPLDNLLKEMHEIEEAEGELCCQQSSKGYSSDIEEDLSNSSLKKNKKGKLKKKTSTKDRRGSFDTKRGPTGSKGQAKRESSFKEGCNIKTCTSKVCPAKRLGKPMIEVLKHASNLNGGKMEKLLSTETPSEASKDLLAQDVSKIKSNNISSQTDTVNASLERSLSKSPSRGSTSSSEIPEKLSNQARSKTPSQSSPENGTAVSTQTTRQSRKSDKKQSDPAAVSRKPTTSTDNTAESNTSPGSRKATISPDSKSITSDKRQRTDKKPSIRFPDKREPISSDKRKSITSTDKISSSERLKEGSKENIEKTSKISSRTDSPNLATQEKLPAKTYTRASQTDAKIGSSEKKDRNISSRGSPTSQKDENASISARSRTKTRSPDNLTALKSPDGISTASSRKKTRSPDNLPSIRSPDKMSTASSSIKSRSPDRLTTIRSPHKISPASSSIKSKSPENLPAPRSLDKKPTVRSPDKKASLGPPDKRSPPRSADKKQSKSPSDKITGTARPNKGCNTKTCTSKECPAKQFSNPQKSKSARSTQTLGKDKPLQKGSYARRQPSPATPSTSPVETKTQKRSADKKLTERSANKKETISSAEEKASVRGVSKKSAVSSSDYKRSTESPENISTITSRETSGKDNLSDRENAASTRTKAIVTKCNCECRTSSRIKTSEAQFKEYLAEDVSIIDLPTLSSLQQCTQASQTVAKTESSQGVTDSSNISRGSSSGASQKEENSYTKAPLEDNFDEYSSVDSKDSETKPMNKSSTSNESRMRSEDPKKTCYPDNKLCECDASLIPSDESSIPSDLAEEKDEQPTITSMRKSNFDESTLTSKPSRPSKVLRKCYSDQDVALREEEMRKTSFSANDQLEANSKRASVFDKCLCENYPTNHHPCRRTKDQRCPCNDEQKDDFTFKALTSNNTTRLASDRNPTENTTEAGSSRKKCMSSLEHSPMDNRANACNCKNNVGCQCTKQPDVCNFTSKWEERRAECNNQALAAFRKLQECFSDFDLEGECFKKLENYAEFHSDIFGPCCKCEQSQKSKLDEKKINSKPLSADEKENLEPKNKQDQRRRKN